MSRIVLFDMDGTLTPPRKSIEKNIEEELISLSKITKIGIVTGSDYEYVMQQCKSLFHKNIDFSNFYILPCNGTQMYVWDQKEWEIGSWKKVFSLDMREHLGEKTYRKLMFALLEKMYTTHMTNPYKFPVTGHFISYRDSLINWCPIGRNANSEDRKKFVKYDEQKNLRKECIERFNRTDFVKDLCFSLGGSTSIDIYPCGWDKTYALKHFDNHEVWFIGDRCTDPNGNDKPLYDKIKNTHTERVFEVKSTEDTYNIIKQLINSFLSEGLK
jgi:phosphomannomutase